MKYLLIFLGCFLVTSTSAQQEFTVSGTVTYGEIPVAGAMILLDNGTLLTQTDSQGHYQFSLQSGAYTLIFSHGNQRRIELELNQDQVIDVDLQQAEEVLDEVFLTAVRVSADSPITYSDLSQEEIEDRNLGQDIPSLLKYLPGVVTTSDAGAGIGYTGLRVRGSDATRINVTINGIPYNDAESQGTFWVNLGDFASSIENLQLQRGVGTSTNGAGAFGASLNILTDTYQVEPSAEIANSFGSYNTRKHTVKFSTGLLQDRFELAGRASIIKSDGYIDRASTDLKSYFFQGTFVEGSTLIKALTFGGSEVTYQAWDGIDAETLERDRRFNPAGAYEDDQGNLRFYENHVDDYKQDHFQLLWNQKFHGNWSSNLALHYTYGRGFYESYREDSVLEEYLLDPFMADGELITESDLITRKWLVNDFYGTTFNVQYENQAVELLFGGGWNNYLGDHFGEIVYAQFAPVDRPFQRYYENEAQKSDFNVYTKATVALSEDLSFYGDLQLRKIHYEVAGVEEQNVPFIVDDSHTFFNPKAGLTYSLNPSNNIYFSYAKAHREPNRTDYESGDPKPEELDDFELGWRLVSPRVELNTNLYYMGYTNQLVLTGELNDVGSPVRTNSGSSYRLGLEVDALVRISDQFRWRPNLALSRNRNDNWIAMWDGELRSFGETAISYSPKVVAGNLIEYVPFSGLEVKLLSKYVGKQYMSNLETEGSILEDFFVSDLNIQYLWKKPFLFDEVVFTALINNIFNEEYVSNGYYYTYDIPGGEGGLTTIEGAGYYPQATRNFLAGVTFKF